MEIHETDTAGKRLATYIVSRSGDSDGQLKSSKGEKGVERVDVIRPQKEYNSFIASIWDTLQEVFLPVGFPASVTDDYLPYQIYDSLQAFASSIAGLLSSRAVLEGVGVGDSTASPTEALLLHILQDSTGRIATILFAHRFGTALEPEAKRYRLLADVLNDCAMLLDCLSPAIPKGVLRIAVLSFSGVLRSLCGVAASAAKASLSVHFAKRGNVGELNAKDASQETVISLMGMLAGSLVVSYVTSPELTWSCLVLLLAIHLKMNHAAVRSVRMNTLNRQRACICLSHLIDTKSVMTLDEVSKKERIFEQSSFIRWNGVQSPLAKVKVGVSLNEILGALGKSHNVTHSVQQDRVTLNDIVRIFANEEYLLWYDPPRKLILIAFKQSAKPASGLQAWAHAMVTARGLSLLPKAEREDPSNVVKELASQLEAIRTGWNDDMKALAAAGWDLDTASLETVSGTRIELSAGTHNS